MKPTADCSLSSCRVRVRTGEDRRYAELRDEPNSRFYPVRFAQQADIHHCDFRLLCRRKSVCPLRACSDANDNKSSALQPTLQ